jgi:phosphatidylethanolamine-binding protein (PEBP) family uncharacterized protein
MAQRTGADGFLASKVKAASVGMFPALAAAAVLALAGCGGNSDAQTQGADSAGASAKEQTQTQKAVSPTQDHGAEADSDGAGQSASKVKQGPHITPPKGPRENAPTQSELESATVANITLESPSLGPAQGSDSTSPLTAEYTCDGKGSWPELRWVGVPSGSTELVLFVLALEPVDEALFFSWAVAGLDSSSEGIEAGRLPKGAIVGRNGFGHNDYEICPDKGKAETYIFTLYALPTALKPKSGFDPASLREKVLNLSGNAGLMAVSYQRR